MYFFKENRHFYVDSFPNEAFFNFTPGADEQFDGPALYHIVLQIKFTLINNIIEEFYNFSS